MTSSSYSDDNITGVGHLSVRRRQLREVDASVGATSENRTTHSVLFEEFERVLSDMARGFEPRTVLHALLAERKTALATEDIVAITGKNPLEVDRILAVLEAHGWVIHFREHGFDKYVIRGVLRGDQ